MDTQLIYTTRGGIQTAIRRGNIHLIKTCFDTLWADPEQRRWLVWRFPIFVMEESWHRVGELPSFLSSQSEAERDWRAQYYHLTLSLKSKDCYAFPAGAINPIQEQSDCRELRLIRGWLQKLAGRDPMVIADAVFEAVLESDHLSDYEVAALVMLRGRAFKGGRYADRMACLIGMLLLSSRGLERLVVQGQLKEDLRSYAEKPVSLDSLPWYCYDGESSVGRAVAGLLERRGALRKSRMTVSAFNQLWLYRESALVPNKLLRVPGSPNNMTPFDSYWWPRLIVSKTARKDALRWKKIRPTVERLVNEVRKR